LVLQTVLWPLLFADTPSQVSIEGGTHVDMAPSYEFLKWSFFPAIEKMGVETEISLAKHGFYPGGGGKLQASVLPGKIAAHLICRSEAKGLGNMRCA
jgi:RNA 3'-terminal phosphate cyclase (ATP)